MLLPQNAWMNKTTRACHVHGKRQRSICLVIDPQFTESEWGWLTFMEHVPTPGTMLSSISIWLSQIPYKVSVSVFILNSQVRTWRYVYEGLPWWLSGKESVKVLVAQSCPSSLLGSSGPWNSPGKNTKVGFHAFLQWIFPTQGSNLGLHHCRQI